MKDFSPHAILMDPSIPDETVEALINSTYLKDGVPVVLLLDPLCSPTPKGKRSLPAPWRVSEKRAVPMPPAEKPQGDTDTHPAPSGQRVPTNRPVQ